MTNLYHRAADMLEYARASGAYIGTDEFIAELRAAAQQSALDELTRENERLGLYDDQKPVAWIDEYGTLYPLAAHTLYSRSSQHPNGQRNLRPLYAAPAPTQPRQPMDDGKLWSFLRNVLLQGQAISVDHIDATHEEFSARMDAAASERVEQLRAITGEKP